MTEQKLSSGLDLDIHKSLVPLDADTMIPTESGLPLRMKLRGMAAIKVTGKVSVSGLPSIFKIIRADQLKKDITLNLELRPRYLVYYQLPLYTIFVSIFIHSNKSNISNNR